MINHLFKVAGLGALALAHVASGVPMAPPVYTFCEVEDNDLCVDAQIISASVAVAAAGDERARDCFFIAGKLQKDCVWDFQPKCGVRVYDKSLQCYDSNRVPMAGSFYEPLLRTSDSQGRVLDLAPGPDRMVRLAIGAFLDSLDGTINGLSQNSPHHETGEVRVQLVYDGVNGSGPAAGEADAEYVFRLESGTDGVRVAFAIPAGVGHVDIYCRNDTGVQPAGWDVDFYHVRHLVPSRSYCVTLVGGLRQDMSKTEVSIGWFDKQWTQIGQTVYGQSELCVLTDGEGDLRFAVSGGSAGSRDFNFNGLRDELESDYHFFHFLANIMTGSDYQHRPGASAKDDSAALLNRYPRPLWEDERFAGYFGQRVAPEFTYAHWEVGEYCLKVRLAEHVHPSERPEQPTPPLSSDRVDMNGDGVVNALDLALLLSYWGIVPDS